MKRLILILVVILIAIASFYVYSFARSKIVLPKPEDMAGREASAFLPKENEEGKPAAKGSSDLKLTGPVWVAK